MTQSKAKQSIKTPKKVDLKPELEIKKIGIVARDYNHKFSNGYRDFSQSLPEVLNLLDNENCDTVLFSLFSIIPRCGYAIRDAFNNLKKIKVVLIEEFKFNDGNTREPGRYVVYYKKGDNWEEYGFQQIFSTITKMPEGEIYDFVKREIPKRIFINFCILLCGETNGVKYEKAIDKRIHDTFGLRKAMPQIILNPIHDKMTRFEMCLKRKFLSENKRLVISVWNKGRYAADKTKMPWTIFYNGEEVKKINTIENNMNVDIGVFEIIN